MAKDSLNGSDALEQLIHLRYLTEGMGYLHEAQLLQLKMWPRLLFPQVLDFGIDFDFKDHKVTYVFLTYDEMHKAAPENMAERCLHLNEWIQTLLGPAYYVEIRESAIDGDVVFAGVRSTPHVRKD